MSAPLSDSSADDAPPRPIQPPNHPTTQPPNHRLFLALFPLLASLLLWSVLFGGQVLLPAAFLPGFSPWDAGLDEAARQALPQWNALQWDGMAEFYPWRLHAAREVGAGRVPLWNPYVLCGTPFLANSQSAPLYPLHLLYYLPLGASVAERMGWLAFVHLSLAGAFAYLLARDLGARPLAAALGGAAFELSGYAVSWLALPSVISVSCWIPLVLLCLGRAVRRGSYPLAAGTGAAIGMMLLAGHLQFALYGLLAAGAVWLWETGALLRSEPASGASGAMRRAMGRSVLIGIAAISLGIALAAPQLLPSLELSRMSHRVSAVSWEGYRGYVGQPMQPLSWIMLLVPDYYGLPGRGDFWGYWPPYFAPAVMEYAGFIGTGGFVFALLGLARGRRMTPRAALVALAAGAALLIACGTWLAAPAYFLIPGFSQTGSIARILILVCLAQAMLAALGLEWLCRRAEEDWKPAVRDLLVAFGAVVLIALGLHLVAAASVPRGAGGMVGQVSLPALTRALLFAGGTALLPALLLWLLRDNRPAQRSAWAGAAALACAAGGLLLLGSVYNLSAPPGMVYPITPHTAILAGSSDRVATLNRTWGLGIQVPPALLPPNASLALGWRDAQGYDSLYLGSYRRLANAISSPDAAPPENGNMLFIKDISSPLFPLLGVRRVVSPRPLQNPALVPDPAAPPGPPFVYRCAAALPEAYLAASREVLDDTEALERLSLAGPRGLRDLAVLSPGTAGVRRSTSAPGPSDGSVLLQRQSPGHLVARVTSPAPALLVLLEAYAPGWRATVLPDGGAPSRAALYRTNVAFQGVDVPAGSASVRWSYEPASFRAGLFLALAAMAVMIAATFFSQRIDSR